jgi:hypothetical protein
MIGRINNGGTAQIVQTGAQAMGVQIGGNLGNVGAFQVVGIRNTAGDLAVGASGLAVGGRSDGLARYNHRRGL